MIAVSSSSRSFAALGRYLVTGRDKVEQGRVAWASARNLPTDDPELAAKIMRATASQNVRVSQPVYHLALSFDPRDTVSRADMERVADHVLAELKLREHQAIIVAHADRDHPHMHVLVNRVHPQTGLVWDRWQDYPTIQRALREEERSLGVRTVASSVNRAAEREAEGLPASKNAARESSEASPSMRRRERNEEALPATLRLEFEKHERVSELLQQRYAAERDVAAAGARRDRIEMALQRADRSEAAFEQALDKAYRDPVAAKTSFLAVAEQTGEREAARRMRDTPEAFGELATAGHRRGLFGHVDRGGNARAALGEAAAHGAELVGARREAAGVVDLRPNGSPGLTQVPVAGAREMAGSAFVAARQHLERLREAERPLPSREHVELRLAQQLRRLSPPEFEKLRSSLSPARLSLAHKLRRVARDAVLGREEE